MRQRDVADWKANPLGRVTLYLIMIFWFYKYLFSLPAFEVSNKHQNDIKNIALANSQLPEPACHLE
jgi:hypothetical protein